MEGGYHDRQGNGNSRYPTQEEGRCSECAGGEIERFQGEERINNTHAPRQGSPELEKMRNWKGPRDKPSR